MTGHWCNTKLSAQATWLQLQPAAASHWEIQKGTIRRALLQAHQLLAVARRLPAPVLATAAAAESPAKAGVKERVWKQFRNAFIGVHMAMLSLVSSSVFAVMMQFGKLAEAVLPTGADSSTSFEEMREMISKHTRDALTRAVQSAGYYALSLDEKEGCLILLVSFVGKDSKKETHVLAYGELCGHDAADLAAFVIAALERHGLPKKGLVSMTADGASVTGCRRALSQTSDGNNVLSLLSKWANRTLQYWESTAELIDSSSVAVMRLLVGIRISANWSPASRHCTGTFGHRRRRKWILFSGRN